jgi:hypothetical protein
MCSLILVSVARFGTAQASTSDSSIPKPSVPEFTVALVDSSYDVPTTYSIDPYTGENVTHLGYHVERTSIEVKIKNQPFTPYEIQDSYGNNWTINFFYNIRIKGHFSGDWIELYRASDGYLTQSDLQYTVISYVWGGDADTVMGTKMIKLPAGGQVDFQVEAMIGYVHREITIPVPGTGWVFTGETSGWSNTQTITIGESQTPTPSPATTPTPTAPNMGPTSAPTQEPALAPEQLEVIIGAAVAVAVLSVSLGLFIYLIKRK